MYNKNSFSFLKTKQIKSFNKGKKAKLAKSIKIKQIKLHQKESITFSNF